MGDGGLGNGACDAVELNGQQFDGTSGEGGVLCEQVAMDMNLPAQDLARFASGGWRRGGGCVGSDIPGFGGGANLVFGGGETFGPDETRGFGGIIAGHVVG